MTRTHKISVAVLEGAAVHTAVTAVGLAALVAWAGYCERRRHPA